MSYLSGQDWEPHIIRKTNITPSVEKPLKNEIRNDEPDIKPKISLSNSLLIQNGRKQLNFSQKDLAKKLNIDSKIIQGYECGKIIPEHRIMCQLEKILKIKLNKKKTQ